jgi:hypothetical protein
MFGKLEAMSTLSFKADPPVWYIKQLTKANKMTSGSGKPLQIGSGLGKHGGQDQNKDDTKQTKVFNNQRDNKVCLLPDEKYLQLVHYKNLEACENNVVTYNGETICNNWHIRGHCLNTCKRKDLHTCLPAEKEKEYLVYVGYLRAHHNKFKNNHSGTGNNCGNRNGCECTDENTADLLS